MQLRRDQAKLTVFDRQRKRLLALAYRMTGSAADAEDVVQDAWLRWQNADHSSVESSEAYLATIVSRLCLDRLRYRQRSKIDYVGSWLPEPVLTEPPDEPFVEHPSDISFALMVALERLSPSERAAFILHDVFDVDFEQIAGALGRSSASCRQLAKRARDRLRAEGPRFEVAADDHEAISEAFFRASRQHDVSAIMDLLADRATLHSDGGGRKLAALNVIKDAHRVARFYAGLARKPLAAPPVWRRKVRLNGLLSELTLEDDGTRQATAVEIVDGQIMTIYLLRNPEKLERLWRVAATGSPDTQGPDRGRTRQ